MLHDDEPDSAAPTEVPLVLVVDDELVPRASVCRMVRGLGYRAKSLESGRQALRYLDAHPGSTRLMLADVGMPGMDGAELAERAKDLEPRLRIALLADTGMDTGELLAGYRDLPVLFKPVGFGELYGLLREHLGPPTLAPTSPMAPSNSARSRTARRPSGRHGL